MEPKQYTGKDWTDLIRQMDTRLIRNSLKRAFRAAAKKVQNIAVSKLHATGIQVRGNASDWDKGVRAHVYSRGGGFMITVKPRKANRKSGKGEKSMHENRYYSKTGRRLPILEWMEEGTGMRKTKSKTKFFIRRKKGHSTGRLRAYGFLDKATPEMFKTAETDLGTEVGIAVGKVAKKCGFT